MSVAPIHTCPFCNTALVKDKKRQRLFLWSDCENSKCDSQFMQYSYQKLNSVILWKFNLKLSNDYIKVDFHFPINKKANCGILGYKKDENGSSKLLFEIDSVFEPNFLKLEELKSKIESLILFA